MQVSKLAGILNGVASAISKPCPSHNLARLCKGPPLGAFPYFVESANRRSWHCSRSEFSIRWLHRHERIETYPRDCGDGLSSLIEPSEEPDHPISPSCRLCGTKPPRSAMGGHNLLANDKFERLNRDIDILLPANHHRGQSEHTNPAWRSSIQPHLNGALWPGEPTGLRPCQPQTNRSPRNHRSLNRKSPLTLGSSHPMKTLGVFDDQNWLPMVG